MAWTLIDTITGDSVRTDAGPGYEGQGDPVLFDTEDEALDWAVAHGLDSRDVRTEEV